MRSEKEDGWVMIGKKGFILGWTWNCYRRDAIGMVQEQFPGWSRRQILRRYKPVKATREIVVNVSVNPMKR